MTSWVMLQRLGIVPVLCRCPRSCTKSACAGPWHHIRCCRCRHWMVGRTGRRGVQSAQLGSRAKTCTFSSRLASFYTGWMTFRFAPELVAVRHDELDRAVERIVDQSCCQNTSASMTDSMAACRAASSTVSSPLLAGKAESMAVQSSACRYSRDRRCVL